jgi:hypothetical protein
MQVAADMVAVRYAPCVPAADPATSVAAPVDAYTVCVEGEGLQGGSVCAVAAGTASRVSIGGLRLSRGSTATLVPVVTCVNTLGRAVTTSGLPLLFKTAAADPLVAKVTASPRLLGGETLHNVAFLGDKDGQLIVTLVVGEPLGDASLRVVRVECGVGLVQHGSSTALTPLRNMGTGVPAGAVDDLTTVDTFTSSAGWKEPRMLNVSFAGLSLFDGAVVVPCYRIVTSNGVEQSRCAGTPLLVDLTPATLRESAGPRSPQDGVGHPGARFVSASTTAVGLAAAKATDPQSGVAFVDMRLVVADTVGNGSIVFDSTWARLPAGQWVLEFAVGGLSGLPAGATMTGLVRVTNGAGLQSVLQTVVTYDVTPPLCSPLVLQSGSAQYLRLDRAGRVVLAVTLECVDMEVPIAGYEVRGGSVAGAGDYFLSAPMPLAQPAGSRVRLVIPVEYTALQPGEQHVTVIVFNALGRAAHVALSPVPLLYTAPPTGIASRCGVSAASFNPRRNRLIRTDAVVDPSLPLRNGTVYVTVECAGTRTTRAYAFDRAPPADFAPDLTGAAHGCSVSVAMQWENEAGLSVVVLCEKRGTVDMEAPVGNASLVTYGGFVGPDPFSIRVSRTSAEETSVETVANFTGANFTTRLLTSSNDTGHKLANSLGHGETICMRVLVRDAAGNEVALPVGCATMDATPMAFKNVSSATDAGPAIVDGVINGTAEGLLRAFGHILDDVAPTEVRPLPACIAPLLYSLSQGRAATSPRPRRR